MRAVSTPADNMPTDPTTSNETNPSEKSDSKKEGSGYMSVYLLLTLSIALVAFLLLR